MHGGWLGRRSRGGGGRRTVQADASAQRRLPGAPAADELRARDALTRPVRKHLAALDVGAMPARFAAEIGATKVLVARQAEARPRAAPGSASGSGRHPARASDQPPPTAARLPDP